MASRLSEEYPTLVLGALGGGSPMSMSILGNAHIPCHYFLHCPCDDVDFEMVSCRMSISRNVMSFIFFLQSLLGLCPM